jgi:hypothetical protein
MKESKDTSRQAQERLGWFQAYASMKNTVKPPNPGVTYPCPCCGYKTLSERGGFDICPVCFWEDDGQDDHDADVVRGGPNYSLSLAKARENFREFGACQKKHVKNVRSPLYNEQP